MKMTNKVRNYIWSAGDPTGGVGSAGLTAQAFAFSKCVGDDGAVGGSNWDVVGSRKLRVSLYGSEA